MKIFLAGDGGRPFIKNNFYKFYRLNSYEYLKKQRDEIVVIDKFKDYILDSGVFSFLNGKNTNIDWEKYMVDYANFVREHKIKNYVELDIDKMIGLDNVEILRKKLQKRVGWKSIPVWHMNRGYEKWLEICRDYDYICFGAFLTDGLSNKKFIQIKKFLEDAKKEDCKVHGLGFTQFQWLKKLPFYSVDSSSWTTGNRFGSICKYEGDRVRNLKRPDNTRIKDGSKLANHNFNEWIKYCRWAEKNIIKWFVNIPHKKTRSDKNERIIMDCINANKFYWNNDFLQII